MTNSNPFNIFIKQSTPYVSQSQQYNTSRTNKQNIETNTLRGVLLNNHIKDQAQKDSYDFSSISSMLLIPETIKPEIKQKYEEDTFNAKKALKPLLAAGLATAAATGVISFALKGYSKTMAKEVGLIRPGDLARNVNIMEEPQFAMYQLLRDPDPTNRKLLGFIGVALMSAITLFAKNFTDGVKEIWIKKQNCDIEHNLQENLINVETEVFAGKLNVVNSLLSNTAKYFEDTLNNKNSQSLNFKNYINFKGNEKKENEKKSGKKNLLFGILGIVGLGAGIALLYKNWEKTASYFREYLKKCSKTEIDINFMKALQKEKPEAIKETSNILKLMNAQENTMREKLSKIPNITQEEIDSAVTSIKSAQIYAQAPEALGGISEKIQYYCYMNEERGHFYNWILNPENKFNKYLFLSFCAISSTGYIGHAAADALKDVAVSKENAKSELNLRKKLISTEINNFKSKKLSAINPMIEKFEYELKKGKSKDELKEMAENILIEIKNGPPYVYS